MHGASTVRERVTNPSPGWTPTLPLTLTLPLPLTLHPQGASTAEVARVDLGAMEHLEP
jgi:hypothetical protein